MLSIKSALAKPFAKQVKKSILKWANNPIETQNNVFQNLIKEAVNTEFGKDHDFYNIKTHEDFSKKVPIRDYEDRNNFV